MPAKTPRHKGTGLLPVVHGLKILPGGRDVVPEHLQHYLSDRLLPSAWYPERDYDELIQALAGLIPPESVGGDVWAYFGRAAAQRDLAGQQDTVSEGARIEAAGAYKRLMQGVSGGVAGLALRTMKLWGLYHDTGRITVQRSRGDDATMILRIVDFPFAVRGMIDLQMAYILEFGRLVKVPLHGKLTRATTDGDPFCEWEYRAERTPENVASLAQFPIDAE